MYLLYSALLALALVCGAPYWLYEILRHGKYRRGLSERFGFIPRRITSSTKPTIWVHAVSVGEVLAVSEIVRCLQNEFSQHRVVISTTTDTGQKLARDRFGAENVFYFPFDFKFCVTPYFKALRPELVVVAETEFWPNFLQTAKQRGARIAVVNARISDRSLPGYRRWRSVLVRVLCNIDLFLAQTAEDARRLQEIGAPFDRVFVAGNLKYDVAAPTAPIIVSQLRSAFESSGSGPILVCGSTVDGEEPIVLDAFKAVLTQYPAAVMLLAPRHPERFEEVTNLLRQSSLPFHKRSAWNGESFAGGILLIDSIGELASLYALADVAFVGGSLVPRGGHSILEPAQHGVAIVIGPHTENFRDIVELFRINNAVRIVNANDARAPRGRAALQDRASDAESFQALAPGNGNLVSLDEAFLDLLENEEERRALGRRAAETLQSQRGATQFTLNKLRMLLQASAREAHTA